ncbi:unnamed protein product [Clonostachys chloroleuca]|uniref:Uncharacterized protein n=1 Tax=Clonostachys chloroleuca TaxID=1926264 RepID=A0AA35M9X7_9HYPO|nr:unnamed protein product [Clonostachys chloroleuca]
MRRDTRGENGGQRVADSLFSLAHILEDFKEYTHAAQILSQIVAISGNNPDMRPHLARAYWFLANVEAKIDQGGNHVAELRNKARESRKAIDSREWPDDDTDEGFMRLVGWMLWPRPTYSKTKMNSLDLDSLYSIRLQEAGLDPECTCQRDKTTQTLGG